MDNLGGALDLSKLERLRSGEQRRNEIVPLTSPVALPTVFVRLTDRDIPDAVIQFRDNRGKPELRRELTVTERGSLERRADDLRSALTPWPAASRDELAAALCGMLGAYPAMQRYNATAITGIALSYLEISRNGDGAPYPHWAIARACELVRTGQAGIEPNFCPPEPVFTSVVRRCVEVYEMRLRDVEALLSAKVDVVPQRPVPAPPRGPSGHLAPITPWREDPERRRRVAAELERRRAQNAGQEPEAASSLP